jgi:hypothetical protein
MNSQMLAVMQRRGELLARIAAQREQVAEIGARLRTPLALADLGVAAARFLRSNSVLAAGVIAALVIRRRGMVGMARVIWRVWKGYRRFTAITARLSSRRYNQ